MDKQSVIGKIGTILSDLQKQQEFFTSHPESLNEVEVELFAASASYLAEYAKVLKKFPVSRMGTPLVPPKAAAQAVVQEEDDDDIGFRLSFEEDDAVKPRVAGGPVLRRDQDTPDNEMPAGIADTPGRPASPGTRPAAETSRGAVPADASPANASPANASPENASPAKPEGTSSETPSKPSFAAGTAAESARTSAEPARTSAEAEATGKAGTTGKVETTAKAGTTGAAESARISGAVADAPIDQAQPRVDQAQPRDIGSAGAPREAASDHARSRDAEPEIPAAAKDEAPRRVSLNDRFGEKKSTLYERIAPAQQQQPSQAPVANLGRSIGINERYYFIKTLFQDDKVAFDQAITRIDMCHSLGEALEYANKSLAGKFNWSRKEEDARKFYDLLKRRFL